jgi:DNA-binding PucR family transcriptional regulator
VSLIRANQLAHIAVWRWFVETARSRFPDPAERVGVIEGFTADTFMFTDAITARASAEHAAERERWVRSAAAVRAETIEELLSGEPLDEHAASRALGYELGRHHVAFVVWRDAPQPPGTADSGLEQTATELARSLGAGEPLLHPIGAGTLSAWIGSDRPLQPETLGRVTSGSATSVAIGSSGPGLQAFRRSHREAVRTREIARLSRLTGAIHYRDVAVLALGATDPQIAREFATAELGDLARPDEATRRLAETLRVYLAELGSPRRAGHRLGIHENTVANRIRAAEEILGRPADQRVPQLMLALELLPLIGAG